MLGRPAICYHDSQNDEVRYARAGDSQGNSWGAPVTVCPFVYSPGTNCLRVVDGNPAISTENAHDLVYVRASDTSGTTWGTPLYLDAMGGFSSLFASMAIADGKPAIAYHDPSKQNLKYIHALDATGATWASPATLDSMGDVGSDVTLVVFDEKPSILYYDKGSAAVKYIQQVTPPSLSVNWIALPP